MRVPRGDSAVGDAGKAVVEPGLDGGLVTDAAAELDRQVDGGADRLDGGRIGRPAGKGTVEIDQVQVTEAGRGPGTRLRRRIGVEHGDLRPVALLEAHAFAVRSEERLVGEGCGGTGRFRWSP